MSRHLRALFGALVLTLFLVSPVLAQGTIQVGFDVGGGGPGGYVVDEQTIGGSLYIDFNFPLDTSRIASDQAAGITHIRLLRHYASCPTLVAPQCGPISITDLGVWAGQHPGMVYSMGNEPGNPGQDSSSGLSTWAKAVYAAIKANDPTAFVYGPGVLNWGSSAAKKYNALGTSYDGVAFHLYPPNLCLGTSWLSSVKSTINAATSYAATHGKPAIMTEMSDDYGCSGTEAHRTSFVSQAKAYMLSKSVVGIVWFTQGDIHEGYATGWMINTDGSETPEAAGLAN